ncbi:hypothetical protein GCWU000246_00868 [Jonquetella anthropi E3_33 E1]|nr:hypothetical protein GCWU000246_00868 [Jonquetella anthropi E3_33 E1]
MLVYAILIAIIINYLVSLEDRVDRKTVFSLSLLILYYFLFTSDFFTVLLTHGTMLLLFLFWLMGAGIFDVGGKRMSEKI